VGDEKDRFRPGAGTYTLNHLAFCFLVEGTCRFVEDEEIAAAIQSARDTDTLPLAA
jgi:hypothetical protein